MCLDIVYDEQPKRLRKENGNYVGWKVFNKVEGRKALYPQCCDKGKALLRNRWIHEKKWRVRDKEGVIYITYTYENYETGFHIYRSKRDAMDNIFDHGEIVHKVYFKDIVAYGEQCGYRVIVAKKIYIVDEE